MQQKDIYPSAHPFFFSYEKKIGDQMRQDPTLWVVDPLIAVDNVLNRKCVYPAVNIQPVLKIRI